MPWPRGDTAESGLALMENCGAVVKERMSIREQIALGINSESPGKGNNISFHVHHSFFFSQTFSHALSCLKSIK
jgi:hypothetical protein